MIYILNSCLLSCENILLMIISIVTQKIVFFPVKSSSNLSCGSCTLLNLQTGAFFGAKNGQNVREILYQESYLRINSSYSHIPYPRLTSSSSYIKLFRKVSQWFLLNIELWKQFSTPILDFKILFNIRMIPSITTGVYKLFIFHGYKHALFYPKRLKS